MILRIIFLALATSFIYNGVHAQRSKIKFRNRLGDTLVLRDIAEKKPRVKPGVLYRSELSVGPLLSTDAYGLSINYGRSFGEEEFGTENFNKNYHSHTITLDLIERLHPKDYIALLDNGLFGLIFLQGFNQAAMYGKTINFYNARLTYGQRRLFGGRGEERSPLVQYYYQGGLTMGILKPYYVSHAERGLISYTDTTKEYFIETGKITGKGGMAYGWDEVKLQPGITVRGGFHIDFAKKIKNISAIDVGLTAEYYFKPIVQMAYNPERSFFGSIYLTYYWGRRFKSKVRD